MASTANYLDPRILAEIQGLSLRAMHVVDGFLSGTHRNSGPGSSTEYSQHRQYVQGDDLRHVDWKALARTDRIYVKQFQDERNLACTLLVDTSNSMRYRGPQSPMSKLEYGLCLAGSLAWLLHQQGDATGISLNRDGRQFALLPAATDYQLSQVIKGLESAEAHGNQAITKTIREWAIRTEHRQMVVIVSDCLTDQPAFQESLTSLRQFGHDVILFQVFDPDETNFPFEDFIEFSGMEGAGSKTLDAESIRQTYLSNLKEFHGALNETCFGLDVHLTSLNTTDSLGLALNHFLESRNRAGA